MKTNCSVLCFVCGCEDRVDLKEWHKTDGLFYLCQYCLSNQYVENQATLQFIIKLFEDDKDKIAIEHLYQILDHWLFLERSYQPKWMV